MGTRDPIDWQSCGVTVVEIVTDPTSADRLASLAATTFPLACPPHSPPEDVAAHIRSVLGADRFAAHIADLDTDVLVARPAADGAFVGYAVVHHGSALPADVGDRDQPGRVDSQLSEISKFYVLPDHHGDRGRSDDPPSRAMMRAALRRAAERESAAAWLGVNEENHRALRFYTKSGFTRIGTRAFDLNGRIEHDYVLMRPV